MNQQKIKHPSYVQVDPNSLNAIGIQLTNKCNLTCRHCGADSSPQGEGGPSIEWICDLINAISDKTNINTLMITGGEPFLRYNDLLRIAEKGAKRNLKIKVVTNGYWGKNTKLAQNYINELAEAGLCQLTISVDKIHQEFIEEKNIENIIKAVHGCKKKIPLRIYTLEGEFCNNEFMSYLEENYSEDIDIGIFSQPLLPVGRALANKNELSIIGNNLSESDNHPCHLVLYPFIDHQKNWFICSNSSTLGAESPFFIGVLKDPFSLNEFMDRHLRSNLFRFMKNIGPIELVDLLKESRHEGKYVSVCDLCLQNFRKKNTAQKICKILSSDEVTETLNFIDNELRSNA